MVYQPTGAIIQLESRGARGLTALCSVSARFDLRIPIWSCPRCESTEEIRHLDLVRCGFFRASPVNLCTVVHEDVFVMWQELRSHSPGTSLTAFVRSIQKMGATYGCVSRLLPKALFSSCRVSQNYETHVVLAENSTALKW